MRIMIFGRPGSVKSTYARALQQQLNIPLHHLDRYFFLDNWIERDSHEFLKILQSFIDQNDWIIDGNCLQSIEMRYKRADVCIYLNYPRWLCYWRILKRRFSKDKSIEDRPPNCKEVIRTPFLRYTWNFDRRIRPMIKNLQKTYPQVKFMEYRSS